MGLASARAGTLGQLIAKAGNDVAMSPKLVVTSSRSRSFTSQEPEYAEKELVCVSFGLRSSLTQHTTASATWVVKVTVNRILHFSDSPEIKTEMV